MLFGNISYSHRTNTFGRISGSAFWHASKEVIDPATCFSFILEHEECGKQ